MPYKLVILKNMKKQNFYQIIILSKRPNHFAILNNYLVNNKITHVTLQRTYSRNGYNGTL